MVLDEDDTKVLWIIFREDKIEDQVSPAAKVSTSGGVVGDDKQGDNPGSERF